MGQSKSSGKDGCKLGPTLISKRNLQPIRAFHQGIKIKIGDIHCHEFGARRRNDTIEEDILVTNTSAVSVATSPG